MELFIDLGSAQDFVEIEGDNQKLVIEDLSSEDVQVGSFEISMTLSEE